MAQFKQWFEQDFTEKIEIRHCESVMFSGDDQGTIVGVYLYENGVPYSGGGTVAGAVKRSDGGLVAMTGALSGNAAYVVIPPAALAVAGPIGVHLVLSSGNSTTTILKAIYAVDDTTGFPVDPGDVVPDYEELLAEIENMRLATAAANAAAVAANSMGVNLSTAISANEEYIKTVSNILHSPWTYDTSLNQATGALTSLSGWAASDFVSVQANDFLTIYGITTLFYVFYDSSKNYISGSAVPMQDIPGRVYTLIAPANAEYLRIAVPISESFTVVVTDGVSAINKSALLESNGNLIPSYKILRFGAYIDAGNWTSVGTNAIIIDAIPIQKGKTYKYANLYGYFCFVHYTNLNTTIRLVEDPAIGAACGEIAAADDGYAYLTISTADNSGLFYFGAADSMAANYLRAAIAPEHKKIKCGPGQPFTTLRSAIAEAVKSPNSEVTVFPGTYDLTVEFADVIQGQSGTGIILSNGVYVKFLSGAYVKALFPTSNDWISTNFAPFSGYDFTLDGLNIESSNCRYCVHDELNGYDIKYHNVYKNCVMKHTINPNSGITGNLYHQCIGGGLGKYGYIEIIGGKYTTVDSSATPGSYPAISYHNGWPEGADSKIFINDVYLDGNGGYFRFGYYGASMIPSQVYISGCSMGAAISKGPENETALIDNFTITEWNNTIRS